VRLRPQTPVRETMANVLIAGCGDLGTALGLRLANNGHAVWGCRRNPDRLPPQIRGLRVDLSQAFALSNAPRDFAAVFIITTADRFDDASYRRAYVAGTSNLLSALQEASTEVGRVVLVSSTSVYGQKGGEWVDEDSPAKPEHFSGRRILEAEELLLTSPFPSVVLRSTGIYGSGRRRLVENVRAGRESVAQGPPRYVNLIHRDDLVGVLHHIMQLERPEPVYLGVDHEPVDRNILIRWLAQMMGVTVCETGREASSGRHTRSNKRCRNDRLVESGYRFRFPTFRQGYASILAADDSEPCGPS
jgi:nucleoside-diphosphate-sugar epimerase